MARRVAKESSTSTIRQRMRLLIRPKIWISLVALLLLGGGAHLLWRQMAPAIAQHPQYILTIENVHITPAPEWIRSDVKSQVWRDAGMGGTLSLLADWDSLSRRIKDAFEFHPWVASVERISKTLPSSLSIELTYRRPVAAVESRDTSGITFLPIDSTGIRLPETDLTEAELRYLPRISGVSGRPMIGDVWDDARVRGGVRLITQLGDAWRELKLVEVLPAPRPLSTDGSESFTFELVTTGGTRIVWGAAPGQEERFGEKSFESKRQQILNYANRHGKLESIDGPAAIDVRSGLVVSPRTARKEKSDRAQGSNEVR